MEIGNYKEFLPTALHFLKQYYNVPESNILPWQIYTQKDVQMQTTKTSSYTSGNQNVNNKEIYSKNYKNDPKIVLTSKITIT